MTMAQGFCQLQRTESDGSQKHVGYYRTVYDAEVVAKNWAVKAAKTTTFALFHGNEIESFDVTATGELTDRVVWGD